MTLQQLIQKLADKGDEVYAKICKVTSVDETKRTCNLEPLDGSANIFSARLQATPKLDTGFLMIPEVDSFVVVVFMNKNAAVVSLLSEVKYMHLRGDQFGGLTKIEKLVEKLNNLEKAFNNHMTKYNQHTHTGVTTGTGSSLAPAYPDTQQLAETQKNQLENTKVKHG